ncbi:hypothetical protein NXH64_08400 [Butyrivibrio fibrisolvens]|uniref:hypothetical protein n=1 Tax=Pseudobutyrivibrio ruminis TaxID=46206 RepID=UPI000486AE8D|nr:hypothetical protein [Pseudobutyrivibrio ruminis]MDC7279521.1 hypothetical protein [Butyrivibrio fibrisolvens]
MMKINTYKISYSSESLKNKSNYNLDLDKAKVEAPVLLTEAKNKNVSVSISNEGQKRLEMNQNVPSVENQSDSSLENFNTEEKKKDAYTEYMERMNDVLGKIGKGETVSQKDREWLDGELNSIVSGHYNNLVNMKFERQDVLEALSENMAQRRRMMFDMLKEIEANDNVFQQNFAFLQDEFEIKDKEELVEKLTEALELEEEEEAQAEESEEEVSEEEVDENGEPISLNHDSLENEKRADKQIRQTKEQIDFIGEQSKKEEADSKFYSDMVNSSYDNIMKMVNSSEFSYEDKANAAKDFMKKSYEGTVEKEKSRIKAEFDKETVRIATRFFRQHNDIGEVLKRNHYKVNYISQDIAQALLIHKRNG